MRGEIIEHHVDVEVGLDTRVDVPEKRDEVLRAVLRLAAGEHLAGRDVQRREQIERAVAHVVVGPTLGLAEVHRQDRLRALQRLDLGLFIDGEHDRVVPAGSCRARRHHGSCRRVAGRATA